MQRPVTLISEIGSSSNDCGPIFSTKASLRRHEIDKKLLASKKKLADLEEKPFTCDVCDKGFNTSYRLERHKRMHRVRKPFLCDICNKSFAKMSVLINHKKRLHKNISGISDQRFIRKSTLVSQEFDSSEENPLKCDVSEEQLLHIKEEHVKTELLEFRTIEKSKLLAHQYVHNEKGTRYDEEQLSNEETLSTKEETSIKEESKPHIKTEEKISVIKTRSNRVHTNEQKYTVTVHKGKKAFSCNICKKLCSQRATVLAHQRIHTGERPYSCDVCNKSFKYKAQLPAHMRIHTDERLFKCDICHQQFKQQSNLYNHLKLHKRQNICDICKKKFNTRYELRQHMRSHTECVFICDVCGKKFLNQTSLKRHRLIHAENKKFHCNFCPKQYYERYLFQLHIRTHDAKSKIPYCYYYCKICKRTFRKESSYKSHMADHTADELLLCNESGHENNRKSGKAFICDVCGKGFRHKSKLIRHSQVHTGEKLTCDICQRTYTDIRSLRSHMKIIHRQDIPFTKQPVTKIELIDNEKQMFTESVQNGKRIFSCDICEKQCPGKVKAVIHQRSHTGVKPYLCQVCGKLFNSMHHITDHLRISTGETPLKSNKSRHHPGVKNDEETVSNDIDNPTSSICYRVSRNNCKQYLCDYCPKRFASNAHLVRHRRTHTGEKPYPCGVCIKSFSTCTGMVVHKKRIHNITRQVGFRKKVVQNFSPKEQFKHNSTKDETYDEQKINAQSVIDPQITQERTLKSPQKDDNEDKPPLLDIPEEQSHSVYIKLEFTCDVCEMDFTDRSVFMSHQCGRSEETFSNKEELLSNEEDVESDIDQFAQDSAEPPDVDSEEYYLIIKEEERTVSHSSVRNHEEKPKPRATKRVTSDKLFECDNCGRHYTNRKSIVRHLRIHSNNKKPYKQNVDKTVERKRIKTVGKQGTSAKCDKSFICDICGQQLVRIKSMNKHMQAHSDNKSLPCEHCNKEFFSKNKLDHHRRSHIGTIQFSCEVCKKTFNHRSSYVYHQRVHSGEKPYSCDVCGKTFAFRGNWKTHRTVHNGEKPFSCAICGWKFRLKPMLKIHLKKHMEKDMPSKEKSHVICNVCGKKLARKDVLQKHMFTHSDKKPFPCNLCEKQYTVSDSLRRHMRSHTGEKPYSCDCCNKRFRHRTGFVYHQRKGCKNK